MKIKVLVVTCFILITACGNKFSRMAKIKRLTQSVKEQQEINGSLMIVNDGIMVLAREDKNSAKSTILFATNDSLKEIAQCSYDERIDYGCYIGLKPWISFTGKYLRNDSLISVFLYSGIKILDSCSTCSMIVEEE